MFKCLSLESRRIKADNKSGTNHKATMSGVAVFVFVIGVCSIRICLSTGLKVVSPSSLLRTVSLSNGWSDHFVLRVSDFGFK